MRVNDRNTSAPGAPETGRAAETQKLDRPHGASTGAVDSGGDRVELSSALGRLSEAISAHSAQRAGRVQALATDYQSGRYRADSRATSQSMITEALAAGQD